MRTSKDVLNRLAHDPSLSSMASAVQVGYIDRFTGMLESPAQSFLQHMCDVPQHRIMYFRHAGSVFWHRDTRLDTIFGSSDASRAFSADAQLTRSKDVAQAMENTRKREQDRNNRVDMGRLISASVHEFSDQLRQWIASPSSDGNQKTDDCKPAEKTVTMKVATLNVLNDAFVLDEVSHHEREELVKIRTERWNSITDHIKSTEADAMVLTEVTRAFAQHLLSDSDIRQRFAASDSPASDFWSLPPEKSPFSTGQLILIRLEHSVRSMHVTRTSQAKSFVYANVHHRTGLKVLLCAVHLTAGRATCNDEACVYVEKRKDQLAHVLATMRKLGDRSSEATVNVIAGDFNIAAEEEILSIKDQGYKEAEGVDLHSSFDPTTNYLAKLSSLTNQPKRLDRVYARGSAETTAVVKDLSLFLTDKLIPFDCKESHVQRVHASDHYGVLCTLHLESVDTKKARIEGEVGYMSMDMLNKHRQKVEIRREWSKLSALAFVPEEEVGNIIDRDLRSNYDPMVSRWPPHINVIYPFVHPSVLQVVKKSIQNALVLHEASSYSEAEMKLGFCKKVGCFKHRFTSSVFLQPGFELTDFLKKKREVMYRACERVIKSQDNSDQFEFNPHLTVGKFKNTENVCSAQDTINNQLDSIFDAFQKYKMTSLNVLQRIGGKMVTVDGIQFFPRNYQSIYERSLHFVTALLETVFDSDQIEVIVVGSASILEHNTATDIDIVLNMKGQNHDLSVNTLAEKIQEVINSEEIIIRPVNANNCNIVHIDICNKRNDYLPIDIMWDVRHDDSTSAGEDAIEGMHIFRKIGEGDKNFSELLKNVKQWGEKMNLCGSPFGLFRGIAWSVMSACVLSDIDVDEPEELLSKFCEYFAEFDWNMYEVSVNGKQTKKISSPEAVIRLPSNENCSGSISPSALCSFKRLCSIYESAENLDSMFQEEWNTHYKRRLGIFIELEGHDEKTKQEVIGWVKSKFQWLQCIYFSEQCHLSIRSTSRFQCLKEGTLKLQCGIDEKLSSTDSLREVEKIVLKAETKFRDDFLRWDCKPSRSSVGIHLECVEL